MWTDFSSDIFGHWEISRAAPDLAKNPGAATRRDIEHRHSDSSDPVSIHRPRDDLIRTSEQSD